MFYLFSKSSSKFLFLCMSLCESICRCFNYSFLSLWILFNKAAKAICCLFRILSSCLDNISSISPSYSDRSSDSFKSQSFFKFSASSYRFSEMRVCTYFFISIRSLVNFSLTLNEFLILSCRALTSIKCFSFSFSRLKYAVAS
jgi:hypothetical protein